MDKRANTAESAVRRWLAKRSGTEAEDWFLVSRARHGMTVVFTALTEARGAGGIVTQPFTCITAVNPILVAGHRPLYADIVEETLCMSAQTVGAVMGNVENTRAVAVQHTLGIRAPIADIARFVRRSNAGHANGVALVVEDSAHCVGYIATDGAGKPVADVSVHSFGAEKMFGTKFGGAIWLNPAMEDESLRTEIAQRLKTLPALSVTGQIQVAVYPHVNRILFRLPTQMRAGFARFAQASGLFVQPIMPVELKGKNHAEGSKLPDWIARGVLRECERYNEISKHRHSVAAQYKAIFAGIRDQVVSVPNGALKASHPLVRFPVVMDSEDAASKVFVAMAAAGLAPGKWYRPLLFPGPSKAGAYGYEAGMCPKAEYVSERILNFSTGAGVTDDAIRKTKEILERV